MYRIFSKLATLSSLLCIEEIFFRFCLVAFEVVLSSKVHWFEMKELANQNSSSASSNPYFQLSFEEIVSFAPIFGKCKKPLRGSIRRGMTINVICLFGISTFAMAMVTLSVLLIKWMIPWRLKEMSMRVSVTNSFILILRLYVQFDIPQ